MNRKAFYLDLAERTLWTFVQAAAAVLIVDQDFTPAALKIALTAGAIAVLKALIASRIGKPDASTIP